MSKGESKIQDPQPYVLFDCEILISELKKRPALYDKTLQEYSDRSLKDKLWEEICKTLIINWGQLSKVERIRTSMFIYSK